MPVDVLCIGHAAYDISVCVDGFPAENTKCETRELRESGGGPAANAAYLLSKWGTACAFAGQVGDDSHGQRIHAEFQAVGTDLSLLELRAGALTPVSMILVNRRNGSRTLVNRKVPGDPLRLDPVALAMLLPRVLLFDGHEPEASFAAMKAFPGAVSLLDAGSWREGTAKLAAVVNHVVASEPFAQQATGIADLAGEADRRECIRRLRDQFPGTIVVTLGESGLIADEGSGYWHLPAFRSEAVDTTGAGDIFHGAFAHALVRGWPFRDGLRFASMAASLSVRRAGGRSSTPELKAVEEALAHVG